MADFGYVILQDDADRLWLDEGVRRGWELPTPARALWRCWGFRHLRWFWSTAKAHIEYRAERDWIELWRKEWIGTAILKGWV